LQRQQQSSSSLEEDVAPFVAMTATTTTTTAAGSTSMATAAASSAKHARSTPSSPLKESSPSTKESAVAAQNNANAAANVTTRRRKKPRLHDCQVKLANLREENERLKRHLDVIQNRSQKILKERASTEDTLRHLMENGASNEQLSPLIDAYSEAHSDYGKKRFEELQFHLDQLQVLATPTDFTKMGLWALAGNYHHSSSGSGGGLSTANTASSSSSSSSFTTMMSTKPKISNLLQTELEITDAQSRKILEQRQKIRLVCANHKEVMSFFWSCCLFFVVAFVERPIHPLTCHPFLYCCCVHAFIIALNYNNQ
jgi:hypothetical protein